MTRIIDIRAQMNFCSDTPEEMSAALAMQLTTNSLLDIT